MRKAYYVACGLVYEMAFLAALAVVWRTESVFAAIVIAVPTGFLLSRCVTRTPAFRPVKIRCCGWVRFWQRICSRIG